MNALRKVEQWLASFNKWGLRIMGWLAIALLGVMTTIVLAAVFYRYVLNDAIAWSEEIAKFLMVWMTFMAAPIAYQQGALVAVGALPDALKGRLQQLLIALVQVVVIVIMVVFIKEGSFLAWNARIQTASTVEVSITLVYLSMPLGAVFLLSVAAQFLVHAVQELISPSPPQPEQGDGEDPLNIPGAM